jgi:hypothetical protein
VARNPKSVGEKLARMEADHKKAFDFVSITGHGLMEEGKGKKPLSLLLLARPCNGK